MADTYPWEKVCRAAIKRGIAASRKGSGMHLSADEVDALFGRGPLSEDYMTDAGDPA